ncbi:elongation factor G [Nakamurella aerolata]|uniref:elongation factor G n=1 Tax=Nakamurella aerolata TaxID=1656892 RepID=UPI001BB26628|nr:TetM/TetW/TetO/TetS family tetracycline resistance ribosomal protection protein [Nakamurella aerolata]
MPVPSPVPDPASNPRELLTLGIVAHVDAGKTSLTERLLYDAGVTDRLGSVDAGTTRTDSMDVERRRGITVRAAVTSLPIADLDVTIVDTPGHPDFITEVERSLTVLDAAVLVLSAVEGVQPQTVVIFKALQRIGVPTVVFVNKLDRSGADLARTVAAIRRRLTPRLVALNAASGQGTQSVAVQPLSLTSEPVLEAVAEQDEALLRAWADGEHPGTGAVRKALRRAVAAGTLTPVCAGSAITGAGVDGLRSAIRQLLPPAPRPAGPLAATVFAVDHDDRGRRSWLRLWAGELSARQLVSVAGRRPERVTEVTVSRPRDADGTDRQRATAGQVAAVRGPSALRIGDSIGQPPARRRHRFSAGVLQTLVTPVDPRRRGALFAALTQLAHEDPLIGLRLDQTDPDAPRAAVAVHGEVQREVIATVLAERFGVTARFSELSVICLERVRGSGEAAEWLNRNGNPYLAGIGLRIDPAPVDHGVRFDPGVQRGNLPPAFIAATEEGVRAALQQGRFGWQVTDCTITMTASGYCPRQSHRHQKFNKAMSSVGADFRLLAQVVVMTALRRAGTTVCQPVDAFELTVPTDRIAAMVKALGRSGAQLDAGAAGTAVPAAAEPAGDAADIGGQDDVTLTGLIPTAAVPELMRGLPDLSGGEAVFASELACYQPVSDRRPPARKRSGVDPANREQWFRAIPR